MVYWQEGIRENGKIVENSWKLLWGLEIGFWGEEEEVIVTGRNYKDGRRAVSKSTIRRRRFQIANLRSQRGCERGARERMVRNLGGIDGARSWGGSVLLAVR